MLLLKYLLLSAGIAMFVIAAGILTYDAYLLIAWQRRRLNPDPAAGAPGPAPAIRWRTSVAFVMLAWAPLLISAGIVIVPSGMAGVRVSQTKGTLAGTLYPGVHFVTAADRACRTLQHARPVVHHRHQRRLASQRRGEGRSACASKPKKVSPWASPSPCVIRSIPKRLDYIEANLPQPLEKEIVPPVVATAWRELVPSYTVREVFSAKREEVRQRSAEIIRKRLAADGIVVKEVMLRDIELPQEYAKGLESLLLKEQENDRMGVETEIHQKQVKIAEADAEATKVQQVKQAEGQAAVRVLQAKGESDAMQYTLPLKQKQIRAIQARSRSAQGSDGQECRGCRRSQTHRQQSRRRAPQTSGASRGRAHSPDRLRRRRAHGERGRDPEAESAVDQQNRSRAPLRQIADHDGSGGRQVFLQRHNARNERPEPCEPGRRRGDGVDGKPQQ